MVYQWGVAPQTPSHHVAAPPCHHLSTARAVYGLLEHDPTRQTENGPEHRFQISVAGTEHVSGISVRSCIPR